MRNRLIHNLKETAETKAAVEKTAQTDLQKLRVAIGQLCSKLPTLSSEEIQMRWEQIAELYTRVIEQTSSFFVYQAFLERMVRSGLWENEVQLLDAGSGSSVGKRAYLNQKNLFDDATIDLKITDLDNPEMLRLGIKTLGDQIVGDFHNIRELVDPESKNHIHFNYSFPLRQGSEKYYRRMSSSIDGRRTSFNCFPSVDHRPTRILPGFGRDGVFDYLRRNNKLFVRSLIKKACS